MQHQISLTEAIELTTRYRNNQLPDLPLCETFDRDSVAALIAQQSCRSLRIYLGRKADNKICSILVGADADGRDILPAVATSANEDDGTILEDAFRCPPACPPPSPLNG